MQREINFNPIVLETPVHQGVKTWKTRTVDFIKFHDKHPHIFMKLVELAVTAKSKGRNKYSIAQLFEILRWHIDIEGGEDFKLPNDHKPYYARLLACYDTTFAGFFDFKWCGADNKVFYDWLKAYTDCGDPVSVFGKSDDDRFTDIWK